MFKMMKVCDLNSMPGNAQEQFKKYNEEQLSDNCYIYHYCNSMYGCKTRLNYVDSWLKQNGIKKHEIILVHVSW